MLYRTLLNPRIIHPQFLLFIITLALLFLPPYTFAETAPASTLQVLESDDNHIVLELTTTGYDRRELQVGGQTYLTITVPDSGWTGEAGKPQLPVRGTMVGVPQQAELALKVLADEATTQAIDHPLAPVATQRVQFEPPKEGSLEPPAGTPIIERIPDREAYASSAPYPAGSARIASSGTWRSQRYAVVEFHPVQYNAAKKELTLHKRLRVELAFGFPKGRTPEAMGAEVDEGPFDQFLQDSLINYDEARGWRARSQRQPLIAKQSAAAYSGEFYKVAVSEDGIYHVTCPQLQAAGANVSGLDPATLKLYKENAELAIRVVGDWSACDANAYVEFFGQKANTIYTDTNIYWLTFGGAPGKQMETRSTSEPGTPATTFVDTLRLEQNLIYLPYLPFVEGADHWWWLYVPWFSNGSFTAPYDVPFELPDLQTDPSEITLRLALGGIAQVSHHNTIAINGTVVYDEQWFGKGEHDASVTFPSSLVHPGSNTLRLSELNQNGSTFTYFNYFELDYAREFHAVGDRQRFKQPVSGTWTYMIPGFSSADTQVFDITDPLNTALVSSSSDPSSFALQFNDTATSAREYFAVNATQYKSPTVTRSAAGPDLRSATNGADYIIVAYGDFLTAIQPLADFRSSQGLRVKVINVQDVYDQFSDGMMDAEAIRDFLEYAYNNWQAPAPSYVLLVGDGNYDFKNFSAASVPEPNYIPPYERLVDPWNGQVSTDNRLVTFHEGTTLPDMAIGRLPADSAADVSAMVAKVVSYEQTPAEGDWKTKIAFVSDNSYDKDGNADGGGDFWALSDMVAGSATLVPAPFVADRIYYNPCPSTVPQCNLPYATYADGTAARNATLTAINEGRLIVNYVGHAANYQWGSSDSQFLRLSDLGGLTNGGKMPIMLPMTCAEGTFDVPNRPGLAESNVRVAGNGAVASWSPSGWGVGLGHDLLDRGFFSAFAQSGELRLGRAAMMGKVFLWVNGYGFYRDLIDTYNLLGDPATRMAIPRLTVDDKDVRVQYNTWKGMLDPRASGGMYRTSQAKGATAQASFYGTAIRWVSLSGPDQGIAQVLIDGVSKGTFDHYSPTVQYDVTEIFGGLTNSNHTIMVKVTGLRNANSSGNSVTVDRFITLKTIEDKANVVQYNSWKGAAASGAFAGAYRYSSTANAVASFSFNGTRIAWLTAKGPGYGKAQVLIDGTVVKTVDLYRASQQWQVGIPFAGLSAGTHTIKIKVLGQHSAASTGNTVVVDGFRYE